MYSSVSPVSGDLPPNIIPVFALAPPPAKYPLVQPILPPAAQEVPLYSSVAHLCVPPEYPPAKKPESWVPPAPAPYLAADKAPPVDQDEPLYSSVHATSVPAGCVSPPA